MLLLREFNAAIDLLPPRPHIDDPISLRLRPRPIAPSLSALHPPRNLLETRVPESQNGRIRAQFR